MQDLDNDEFINFDDQVNTSEPTIDPFEVDWRKTCRSQCLAEVIGENSLSESVKHCQQLERKSSQIYGSG